MASHHTSIAKAAFAAALLRPDVTKVSRDELARFHQKLEACIQICSPRNIQNCKEWLLENVIPSSQRTGAFGKYVTSVSKHAQQDDSVNSNSSSNPRKLSAARKRLHLLYVVNDILHHSKYHTNPPSNALNPAISFQPFLGEIFLQAVADGSTRVTSRLQELVDLWNKEQYFPTREIDKLKDILAGRTPESASGQQNTQAGEAQLKDVPFVMPATHGDPSTPYYDLPAANFMPHIMPNSSAPMRPDRIKPLQFAAGPADENLVSALKDFLKEVDAIDDINAYYEDEGMVANMDELGQLSYRDELGDLKGDTYYGWSRSFCERMASRKDKDSNKPGIRRQRSDSQSSSRSPRKRRRYSSSASGRSRSYSTSRSPSQSRSRNRSSSGNPRRQIPSMSRPDISRSISPPRLEPPSVRMRGEAAESFSRNPPVNGAQNQATPTFLPTSPFVPFSAIPNAQYFPPPPQMGFPGFPVPPPRPPSWNGPWPPPPPPPPGQAFPFPSPPTSSLNHSYQGFAPPRGPSNTNFENRRGR